MLSYTKNAKVNLFKFKFFRIYSVVFSMDDKYVLSGSDDTNIRLWKSVSNDPVKIVKK